MPPCGSRASGSRFCLSLQSCKGQCFQFILLDRQIANPMSHPSPRTIDANAALKDRVREFWQTHPCGAKFSEAETGTPEFFNRVEAHRYEKEWHIPEAADFAGARGLRVLEIGCGVGTDGAQFAKAGADYTGTDLTDAAIELARKWFQ